MPLAERQAGRLKRFILAVTVPTAITPVAAAANVPAATLDQLSVLLVIAFTVVLGLGPAVIAAVLAVFLDDLTQAVQTRSASVGSIADLTTSVVLIGIAAVVNRLLARARIAQAAAEDAAERERHARQEREHLVATVAHDLAAPLSAVRGTVQTAKQFGLAEGDQQSRLLRRIETAAARASSLVSTLTEGADVVAARSKHRASTDVRQIVGAVAEMMEGVSNRHPVRLELPDAPIHVLADTERLQRVFENILNNAIKYSPDGGEIRISMARDAGLVTVTVYDQGIGIPSHLRERIFDLAYRAPEARTASDGRGLGLHIAAQIVASHGGRIRAEAAPRTGTAIVVDLPCTSPPVTGLAAHREGCPR